MDSFKRFYRYIPYLILLISITISLLVYNFFNSSIEKEMKNTFNIMSGDMTKSIVARMRAYENVLKGGAGLYSANNDNVSRKMWSEYVSRLTLEADYPGIQAVGFAKIVKNSDLSRYILSMRNSGLQDYNFIPKSVKDRYVLLSVMFPESGENTKVYGFDLTSEPVRREMFENAEKNRGTSLSGKLVLKQDIYTPNVTAGILMAVPVFRDDNLFGFVAAPFRVNSLMEGIFGNYMKGIAIKIYDNEVSESKLMYSSPHDMGHKYILKKSDVLDIFGRRWILNFETTSAFDEQFDTMKPSIMLVIGIITGLLLTMLSYMLLKNREQAYELAEQLAKKYDESEERYQHTFEQAAVGILITTLEMKIFKANEYFHKLSGFKLLEGKYLYSLFNDENDEFPKNIADKLIMKKVDKYESELRLINNIGRNIWVDVTISVFFGIDKVPLYLIVVIDDISRRKKAEDDLLELSLKQSAILENSLVGILQVKDRVIEWVNPTFENMFGFTSGELVGKSTRIIHSSETDYIVFGKDVDSEDMFRDNGVVRTQWKFVKKNGDVIWIDISGKKIGKNFDSSSIWVFEDITERKKSESLLLELNSGLESKVMYETNKRIEQERILMQQSRLAAMGEMIGAIAHQWRQPLNVLSLIVQNLEFDYSEGNMSADDVKEFTTQAIEQIQYMSFTIDDFRNFFKSDKNNIEFVPAEQIENILRLLDSQLKASNIDVSLTMNGRSSVIGVPNEFSQVVLNILNNAKDALTASKTSKLQIKVDISCGGGRVKISILDNAGGIPENVADKIFDPYFTTKGPDKGTGIGLYMSKLIIQDHLNGELYFRNRDGGAEFIIDMPSYHCENSVC